MYLSYTEFTNMGGKLDEDEFNTLEYDSEMIINWYTFNRLKNEVEIPNDVKQCIYRLIPLIKLKQSSITPGANEDNLTTFPIVSQSNDGVSTTYNVLNSSDVIKSCQTEITNIIKMYLTETYDKYGRRILYRGV